MPSYTTFVMILALKWGASIDGTVRISTSVVPMADRGLYRWVRLKVPRNYPPHLLTTISEGLLIMRKGDPEYDDQLEWAMGVTSTFAAIAVGTGVTHILAFSVDGEIHEEEILYSLSAVRRVIDLKLEEQKLAGIMEEARVIQESLLPAAPPDFPGYDIFGHSRAAESVGGKYLRLSRSRAIYHGDRDRRLIRAWVSRRPTRAGCDNRSQNGWGRRERCANGGAIEPRYPPGRSRASLYHFFTGIRFRRNRELLQCRS